MRIDRTLTENYNYLNRRYFAGELPAADVGWGTIRDLRVGRGKRAAIAQTVWDPAKKGERPQILINVLLRRLGWNGVTAFSLLHEMVHVKTRMRDNHGPAFEREMRKLAEKGAFAKAGPKHSPLW